MCLLSGTGTDRDQDSEREKTWIRILKHCIYTYEAGLVLQTKKEDKWNLLVFILKDGGEAEAVHPLDHRVLRLRREVVGSHVRVLSFEREFPNENNV